MITIKKIVRKIDIEFRKIQNRGLKPTLVLQSVQNNIKEIQQFKTDENVKIFHINNGRIDTDNCYSDCYFRANNELIEEITFSYFNDGFCSIEKNNIFSRYLKSPSLKKNHGVLASIISGGGPHANYYHWLFDSLPRLYLILKHNHIDEIDFFYIPNYTQEFKVTTLKTLGVNSNKIIDSTRFSHVSATEIIATTHPNNPPISKWICNFLRETFLKTIEQSVQNEKRIYVSRRKAPKRRIINEISLFQSLNDQFGFKEVFLEDMTFMEQVNTFNSSEIIVSPHGAGLANLVFCKTRTKVVEIFPPNSSCDLYETLSKYVDLDYYSIYCETQSMSTENNLHSDFVVNTNNVLAVLNKIEN